MPTTTSPLPQHRCSSATVFPAAAGVRQVAAADPAANAKWKFPSNALRTTKYTPATFLPKGLFEQFRRVANLYFLGVAALSLSPVSPVSPITNIVPLVLVVAASLVKEAVEDAKRASKDRAMNARGVLVLRKGGEVDGRAGGSAPPATPPPALLPRWAQARWKDVAVGDVILVRDREPLPADAVLLATANPAGVAYVETAGLDGETNLKLRQAVEAVWGAAGGGAAADPSALASAVSGLGVECELPNPHIYRFTGNLVLSTPPKGGGGGGGGGGGVTAATTTTTSPPPSPSARVPLSPDQLLLRGCVLRNTAWAAGLVVFTGRDAKVARNATAVPSKRSAVERRLDGLVASVFGCLGAMAALDAGLGAAWLDPAKHWYLALGDPGDAGRGAAAAAFNPARRGVAATLGALTAVALYSTLIPISLYVSIEVVKYAQAATFIAGDRAMYDAASDTPAAARTSNLNEELGQVGVVLTDKTGTLTANRMVFCSASVGGVVYGAPAAVVQGGGGGGEGGTATTTPPPQPSPHSDARLAGGAWLATPAAPALAPFFRALALCHTVIPETGTAVSGGGGDAAPSLPPDPLTIRYQAASPDEAALVAAARDAGFALLARPPGAITLLEPTMVAGASAPATAPPPHTHTTYDVLAVLEFSAARRRQSVLVRRRGGPPAEGALLLTKGADTAIKPLLDRGDPAAARHWPATAAHLAAFGGAGLRTLCVAGRSVAAAEVEAWLPRFSAARAALDGREAALEAAADAMEVGLHLIGSTGIEDRLQDGVGECIETLRSAGVRVWMLTGDKLETAVNIGYAARLLHGGQVRTAIAPGLMGSGGVGWAAPAPAAASSTAAADDSVPPALPPPTPSGAHAHPADAAIRADVVAQLDAAVAALEAAERAEAATAASTSASRRGWFGRGGGRVAGTPTATSATPTPRPPTALVVEGAALAILLEKTHAPALLRLALAAEAVIFCRASPLQKAMVTRLLRKTDAGVTLAIGDGANDVGMIQAAGVGVGIAGNEGMQAVMAADFALAQFRFLADLLLVHGRWSYQRIALVIGYFFYKNAVYTLTQFWFNMWTGFSAQRLYDDWHQSLFNLLFTSAPVIAAGLLDRDVPRAIARASPHLYKATQAGAGLGPLALAGWAAAALWHSAVCFGVPMLVLAVGPGGGPAGGPLGLWETGTLGFILVVLVVNLRLLLASRTLTAGHAASVAGSLGALAAYLAAYSSAPPRLLAGIAPSGAMHGVAGRLLVCPAAWIAVGLGAAAALLPDVVVVALHARGGCAPTSSSSPASSSLATVVPDAEARGVETRPVGLKAGKVGAPGDAIQLTAASSALPLLLLQEPAAAAATSATAATPGSTPHTGYAFDHPGFESYFADRDDAGRKGRHGSARAGRAASDSLVRTPSLVASTAAATAATSSSCKRRRFSAVEAIALAARGLTGSTSASSSRRSSRAGAEQEKQEQEGRG